MRSISFFDIFYVILLINMTWYLAREYIPGFSEWISDGQDSYEGEVVVTSTLSIEVTEIGCKYCKNTSGLTDRKGNCISCGAPLEKEII